MMLPVEHQGGGEWVAIEEDAESPELEAIAQKLGVDAAYLLAVLARTGFDAWSEEGFPSGRNAIQSVAVDLRVAEDLAKAYVASALSAAT